jgi:ligand-binding SRPBCC domain-containing protein
MQTIILETQIRAPAEVCFDLIRDARIHTEITGQTNENAVVGLGQTVTFEGTHFGMRQRLTVKVTAFERPTLFIDEMIEGRFKSFKHVHEFIETDGMTLMRDTVEWASRLGIVGKIVDRLVIRRHLTSLVSGRNARLKAIAERHNC